MYLQIMEKMFVEAVKVKHQNCACVFVTFVFEVK